MLEFRTQGFNGYAVKYSPYFDSRLAVATSANFGLVGNGRLYILGLTPKGIVVEKWCVMRRATVNVRRSTIDRSLGSIPKIPFTIYPGLKRTRTSSLLPLAMGQSNCLILGWTSFPCSRGRNISGRSSPFIGTWLGKTPFARVPGMGVLRS